MQWLQLGDRNTTFFHRSLLHRHHRNGIHSLLRDDGEEVRDPEEIGNMDVSFYRGLLGQVPQGAVEGVDLLYPNAAPQMDHEAMIAQVTRLYSLFQMTRLREQMGSLVFSSKTTRRQWGMISQRP